MIETQQSNGIISELSRLCTNNADSCSMIEAKNRKVIKYVIGKLNELEKCEDIPRLLSIIRDRTSSPNPTDCILIDYSIRTPITHRWLYETGKVVLPAKLCSMYRWPDVKSAHQIRAMDTCKCDDLIGTRRIVMKKFCLNPYHYERKGAWIDRKILFPPIPPNPCSSTESSPGTQPTPPEPPVFHFGPDGIFITFRGRRDTDLSAQNGSARHHRQEFISTTSSESSRKENMPIDTNEYM